jgi:multiple sugar transport system permease protein
VTKNVRSSQGPAFEPGLEAHQPPSNLMDRLHAYVDRVAGNAFILPAVLVVLFLSIFPLLLSLYLSLVRFKFVKGGFELNFIGLNNYEKLFFGSQQDHFLGVFASPSIIGWLILGVAAFLFITSLVRYVSSAKFKPSGVVWRLISAGFFGLLLWLLIHTLNAGGRPGTVVVTLIYVFVGITVQYMLGLGLALLTIQNLPGKRFFRVVFLIPMMITPVGVAYLFRMLADTIKGPFFPIWEMLGLVNWSWVNDPWSARAAVLIGDIWQWTPFMFIVLLAALEGQALEPIEAALVDGANRRQIFRYITFPALIPVSTTLILIRMIEAFKIIDLPNIMTNGGPGTATESLTLHSFITWRSLDLGGSAAIAYVLLFMVTVIGISYVAFVRNRLLEA